MAHRNKTLEDFENDGFTIYSDEERNNMEPKKSQGEKSQSQATKIVIMDNKDVLKAVQESNAIFKESIEKLVTSMYSMQEKPDNFTLDIERDARGFMKSIKVKVNK